MKSFIAATAAMLSFSTTVAAQTYNQSDPFFLALVTPDERYNGKGLEACHEGAAIEGLCVGATVSPDSSTYQFNTTDNLVSFNATLGEPGLLTYELRGGNFNESEALTFAYNPASNVVLPLFGSYGTISVAFDSTNRMNVQTYLDDTVTPPTVTEVRALYNWYVCLTNDAGYTYETLAWVVGPAPPQNPTCVKVDVVRQEAVSAY